MTTTTIDRITADDHRFKMLPSQPLLTAIHRRGGLLAFFPTVEKRRGNARGDGRKSGVMVRTVAPEARKDYDRVNRALDRASQFGRISLAAADDICCRYLKAHPCEIFGNDYFSLS